MTRILIVGIGGVGGFIGGSLANYYRKDPSVEIIFLARGAHLKTIQTHGLKLHTHHGFISAQPALASENPEDIGVVDFILLCTKSYDLQKSAAQLQPCIGTETVILPLLNGADISEQLMQWLPGTEIWHGCAYMVSRLESAGIIRETSGGRASFAWGRLEGESEKTKRFDAIIHEAGIPGKWEPEIRSVIWKKYIFISTVATLTSYLNMSIGEFLSQEQGQVLVHELLDEVIALAHKKRVISDPDIREKTMHSIRSMPYESTSSMHSDFVKGKQTELETLTGYVVREGASMGVPTPTFSHLYQALKEKISLNG